jgi:glycosyltransferase involved in cell wall biosynthesis
MISGKEAVVVLPAHDAEKTLRQTVAEIPTDIVDEVILTDDSSKDDTFALARQLGLHAIRHARNRGTAAIKRPAIPPRLRGVPT